MKNTHTHVHNSRETSNGIGQKLNKGDDSPSGSKDAHTEYDKELFAVSMRRFLYIRCYDSFEFLATLKTLHFQLQKEKEAHGSGVYLLMIDSIGAFYWMDRASPSIPPRSNNRGVMENPERKPAVSATYLLAGKGPLLEKSLSAKCVRHCRSRDPEDSCGASDACSNYKSSKFTG
ncbi:hypothetical protein KY285_000302 [Solanum tuberosum]|nr:hypothetical protein KY285_000302 [Solanum tuberosum]